MLFIVLLIGDDVGHESRLRISSGLDEELDCFEFANQIKRDSAGDGVTAVPGVIADGAADGFGSVDQPDQQWHERLIQPAAVSSEGIGCIGGDGLSCGLEHQIGNDGFAFKDGGHGSNADVDVDGVVSANSPAAALDQGAAVDLLTGLECGLECGLVGFELDPCKLSG